MKSIPISQVDTVFSNGGYPIEFLFYYARPFSTKRLRSGLRKLSSILWPAFGEYHDGHIFLDRYLEAECFDEETVNRELDIREIEGPTSDIYSRFALPDLKRLFFLKAIRFRNGLVLIPKLSHLAGDGYSYFLLLSALAALTRRPLVPFKAQFLKLALKPNHRRTVLRDFLFRAEAPKLPSRESRLTIESDKVPRREVQAVIREAASSAGLRISTNDVLSAQAVKKLVSARADQWAGEVRLTIPIDVRAKLKEYGRGFFGNGLMFHRVMFEKEQLQTASLLDIAVTIRRSMPSLSREIYIDFLEGLEETISAGRLDELRPYDPERGCLVTNLSRLPTERLDFGTGAPRMVVPLTVEKNGAAILAKGENYLLRYAY
jgi:Transferase family